jgi:UDP-N-acetylbacillosamine N-acetyltransferase
LTWNRVPGVSENSKAETTLKRKLVIWGASGHARVAADIVHLQNRDEIIGYLDDVNLDRKGQEFSGGRILGGQTELKALLRQGVHHAFVAIGDCRTRLRLGALLQGSGFALISLIHPRAIVAADARVGPGSIVTAGAVLNPGAWIGENVIINTRATVEHDCLVEDGAHVAPGVTLAANVVIGRGAWVGIGASVIEGIRVGAGSLIGAGAVVVKDIPDGVVAYGVPARVIRKINGDDPGHGPPNEVTTVGRTSRRRS